MRKIKRLGLSERPKERSKVRLYFGKLYFTLHRYFLWHFGRTIRYARTFSPTTESLPFLITKHQTPLFRQLKNVDMGLQTNKVTNLKLASSKMNGIILRPGETFSFWRLVGKPTKAKGYLEGMVLSNGTFHPGVGGGLCQLSNLIYWMTLHTPLTVTERWRHTHDVFPDSNRTQPFASGATVVYNYVDLQIRNDTEEEYQLYLEVGDNELFGEWRCGQKSPYQYEVYEREHKITHEWWGGYMRHNVICRKIFDEQATEIADEVITENHAIMMYEPLLSANAE
ncbi:VanW family protein [Desulfitobacterium metallireducens]|uniref:Vancomycin B-type resistance protein n=1 Tax=Desulfitobacterium metallireducens DSM 15288 TaxID=871968 RepID=W0EBM3_9FIRM|nr:VanW family protein [Desulfitobacterium metallireducens]AHF08250.1 vancomycin B-type resistance protein [Desulfitobacterium metallireducens DSM 15288]